MVWQLFKPTLPLLLSIPSGTDAWQYSLSMGPVSLISLDTYYCCNLFLSSPCPGTASALSHFSQFHLSLLSKHPDKPVSLSAYNHCILCSLDHTCLSVVQKDYVYLEFSTYFNK